MGNEPITAADPPPAKGCQRRKVVAGIAAAALAGAAGGITGTGGNNASRRANAAPAPAAAPASRPSIPAAPVPADPWAGALVLTAGQGGGNQFPDVLRALESRSQDWWDNQLGNPRPIDVVAEPGLYRNQVSSRTAGTPAWPQFEQYVRGAVRIRSKIPGKMVVLEVTGAQVTNGKGMFNVYRRPFAASWVTFRGARRGDEDGNYSAIRAEPPPENDRTDTNYTITLDHCLIEGCDNGLLGVHPNSKWVLDACHIRNCGSGNGRSHGVYLSGNSVVVRSSLFERTRVGHNFKSRAPVVDISDSRFLDGADGTSSYALDIPNGGAVTLRNVVLHHGLRASNLDLLAVGEEGDNAIGRAWPTMLDIDGLTLLAERPDAIGIWNAANAPLDKVRNVQAFGVAARRMLRPGFVNGERLVALPGATMLPAMPALDRSSPVGAA